MSARVISTGVASLLVAALVCPSAQAQRGKQGVPEVDPYTGADAELMQRAGYVSFGPFRFDDRHDSRQIDELLGGARLRWIETAHFKLGCDLAQSLRSDDTRSKKRLRAELERLAERLPKVKPRTRELDPWLRAHLYAQRLEELYADFSERLGVTDADFPEASKKRGAMGRGPYLGLQAKYTVLLLESAGSLGRYSGQALGYAGARPTRHHFQETGTFLYCTSPELYGEGRVDDAFLHCSVVFGVAQNLIDGYRAYSIRAPVWWSHGLAQWFSRRIDARHNTYTGDARFQGQEPGAWNWEPKIRARVRHGLYPSMEEILGWSDPQQLAFLDQLNTWSRVDFLMSRKDEGFRVFMDALKGPPGTLGTTTHPRLSVAWQQQALERAWGLPPEALEAEWAEFVKTSYSAR